MPCGGSRVRSASVHGGVALTLSAVVAVLAACGTGGAPESATSASVAPPAQTPGVPESPRPAPNVSPSVSASPPAGAPTAKPLPGARTVTGRASSVSGTTDEATLTAYAAMADRAVAAVEQHWTRDWPGRVTLVAPADLTQFREQTGRADDVSQVAAITDGPLDAEGRATADRVVLNPEAFARLTPEGRQFVITHESTHVALRSSLPGAAPLWLVEGFADHVGYAGSSRSRAELAAGLLEKVRAGQGPTRLPTQGDFDPSQGEIAPAYLASWLAVDLIVRRYGEAALQRFYVASTVNASPAQADTAMDAAFREVLGTTRAEFTTQWLAELRRLAG
ncbi:hypothetical protein BCF74_10490 [Knoellia remsis]|uniref:Basic secretory peptidase family protein n=2 Tax=Knoellia remsis TaxID=407159 RepID=A0A2T0UXN9_9MICO|nr:hypothetical protein BCF74_10490 [Knoellia remsis]